MSGPSDAVPGTVRWDSTTQRGINDAYRQRILDTKRDLYISDPCSLFGRARRRPHLLGNQTPAMYCPRVAPEVASFSRLWRRAPSPQKADLRLPPLAKRSGFGLKPRHQFVTQTPLNVHPFHEPPAKCGPAVRGHPAKLLGDAAKERVNSSTAWRRSASEIIARASSQCSRKSSNKGGGSSSGSMARHPI